MLISNVQFSKHDILHLRKKEPLRGLASDLGFHPFAGMLSDALCHNLCHQQKNICPLISFSMTLFPTICVDVVVFPFQRTDGVELVEDLSKCSTHGAPVKFVL